MILVISKDADFAAALAEQLVRQLGQECKSVATEDEAKTLVNNAELAISTEPVKLALPVVAVKAPPIRLSALLLDIRRQLESAGKEAIVFGRKYVFSPRGKQVSLKASGKNISLTDKEAQLLKALISAGKAGIAKEALLKDVWNIEQDMDTHTLETHIYRLRAKLRELADDLSIAATDTGYRLE